MRLYKALVAVALGAVMTATGAVAETPKNTLVVADAIDDVITLDPGEVSEVAGVLVSQQLYQPLVTFDINDPTKIVGVLAKSWEVSPDGKSFTFTSTFDKAPQASDYYKASLQLFATGIVDNDVANTDSVYRANVKDDPFLTPDPASPKGARVDIQTALHFNLAENAEWFGSANNQVKVEMFLAPFKKTDGTVCRLALQSTVQPTAAAATDYSLGFKDNFTFSQACGMSAPDVAVLVQTQPVVALRFSAVQPNGQVANAASKYVSQFKLTGPVYFQ